MKYKLFSLFILLSLLGSLTGAGSVLAQSPEPPGRAPTPHAPRTAPLQSPETHLQMQAHTSAPSASLSAQSLTLGDPGLSFAYSESFGEADVAYPETSAYLNYPWGIGTQGSNLWAGELWGNRAVKYNSAGVYQKQAGSAGVIDLPLTTLNQVTDVAEDGAGNVWVVDDGAAHVAKFNSSGDFVKELGTIYNSGKKNTQFNSPESIAFDAAGNIYVSDGSPWWNWDGRSGNQRIQIFNSAGKYLHTIGVTGVAGSDSAHLHGPRHIATYGSGLNSRLYVADSGNQRVQIFNISNPLAPTYVASIGHTGQAGSDNTRLDHPFGVAVDNAYIYVADTGNHRVQVFNRTNRAWVATVGETGVSGTDTGHFNVPTDVAVDTSGNSVAGTLYVADFVNTRVQQFSRSGAVLTYARTYGATGVPYVADSTHYNKPSGVAVDPSGNIYVTEDLGHRLIKMDSAGTQQWTVGTAGVKGGLFASFSDLLSNPGGVAVDSTHVYVADRWDGRVRAYNVSDGSLYAERADLNCPGGVDVVSSGTVYVADSCNNTVEIYSSDLATHLATMGGSALLGTDFNWPQDVALDSSGNIYVADQNNHRVQVFNSSHNYVRSIGVKGVCGGDFAELCGPYGLAIDSLDRLYVADQWNQRVQVFDSEGAYLTTIGGNWGTHTGELRNPQGVAVDGSGAVYVADWENDRIQKYTPGVTGWNQMNLNGFGDRWLGDTAELAAFHGQLYAAASGDGAQIWRSADGQAWSQMVSNSFGDWTNQSISQLMVFKDQLYAGTWNCSSWDSYGNCIGGPGAQIWRSSDGASWSKVVTGGFGLKTNLAVDAFAVLDGQLYAAALNPFSGALQMYRSVSGDLNTWSAVTGTANGFDGAGVWSDVSMTVYGGDLYVGLGRWNDGLGHNLAELWRCHTCDGSDWTPVFTDGLGNSSNDIVRSIAEYNGDLYIGLRNMNTGGELWSSPDGTNFTKVFDGGLGNSDNHRPDGLYAFNGSFYLILANDVTGAEVKVCSTACTSSGNWTSDMSGGWGDSNNVYADYFDKGAADFAGRLYIGMYNGANGGEIWATAPLSYPVVASIIRTDASPTPVGASSVNFTVRFSEPVTGVDTADFAISSSINLAGATVSNVTGSGDTYTVTVNGFTGNGTLRLDLVDNGTIVAGSDHLGGSFTTGESYVIPATLSFTSVAAQDGWVLESTEISNKGGSLNAGGGTFNVGDDALNRQYRAILSFDTTTGTPLPVGAVITSATLQIKKAGLVGSNPFSTLGKLLVDMKAGPFNGNAALEKLDFQALQDQKAALSFSNNVYLKALSSSYFGYIDPAGLTQFRLRFTKDDNNNLIADYLKFYSGNSAVPANQPTLILQYYVP